jgi:RimJ/RimL family protein N-acetyltransferase
LDRTRHWANDPELNAWILRSLPVSREDQEQWYARLSGDPRRIVLAVKTKIGDEHVANTGFYHLDHLHRHGEFWVLVGQKDTHGRGLGGEITDAMLSFGFMTLNLRRIYLHVRADHKRAVAMYEKRGLRREGLLRGHYYIRGNYVDVLLMAILRNEYDQSQ